MESDIIRLHTLTPPPLDDEDDDDADGEIKSEDNDFGDFHASELPSSFRSPLPNLKPATRQPSFNHPVEQSQPTATVKFESSRGQVDGQDADAESSLRLMNGHAEEPQADAGGCSPKEEKGFADFTVFTSQTPHPWCCGFSPLSNTEQWESRLNGGTKTSLRSKTCDAEREAIKKFEPGSHWAHNSKEKHCECRDAAVVLSSQDNFQVLEAEEAFDFPSDVKERVSEALREDWEHNVCAIPRAFVNEEASEDLPSFSDDLSFEGASTADLEPNVSSLVSHEDSTDWDRTDDEAEELEDMLMPSSEPERSFHHCKQHLTQETCATSSQPQSLPGGRFADSTDRSLERCVDREHVLITDAGVLSLGNLPPSDSFADFCSAPTQDDAVGLWNEFKDQSTGVEETNWTQVRESVSSLQTDVDTEEGDKEGSSRRDSQASLSSHVQHLLQNSFPEVEVPAVEGEEQLLSLGLLLQNQCPPESEEEISKLSGAQRFQWQMLRSPQDIHSAVGIQFRWGGSHVYSTLLSCLGVDTRNIVFMGTRKQPVTVPAFASGLGLLEPTKDRVPAVCSPGRRVVTTGASSGPRDLSAHPAQEEPPSRQLNWSSRGLSSSQDGFATLNLDYFGLEEASRSSSSSPPPGVDTELYGMGVSTLENSSSNGSRAQDTLNRLLSSAEKTCISVRKPLHDGNLSADACSVISGLPDLSFMQAKVLMFPSSLLPKA